MRWPVGKDRLLKIAAFSVALWSFSVPFAAKAQATDANTANILIPGVTVDSSAEGSAVGLQNIEKSQYGTYEKALVREASDSSTANGLGGQKRFTYELEITSGSLKGTTQKISIKNSDLPTGLNPQVGDKLVVFIQSVPGQSEPVIFLESYERQTGYFFIILLFIVCSLILAGKKGLKSLLLFLPLLAFYRISLPLNGFGLPGWVTLTITLAVLLPISGLILVGYNRKLAIVCLSTWIGSMISYAAVSSIILLTHLRLPGLDSLVQQTGLPELGLALLASVFVFDLSIHITQSLSELKQFAPGLDRKDFFKAGIEVGRERLLSIAPLLSVIFIATSTVLLYQLKSNAYPWIRFINSEVMAQLLVLPVSFGLGLMLTIPIISLTGVIAWSRTVKNEDPLRRALGWRPEQKKEINDEAMAPEAQYEEVNPSAQGYGAS